ncbi:hypothetical protein O6H91_11G115500 [Diphasiastrum complanatum]|uniref:Uncharacterized protein n=1 Tax=Diphasiastrum complanatum TaxID=34168 RepID=A0ACC2CDG9_DIPCM|nr:hypothetical protein O6H91_11G115500 [Diphasiastrum complanatum]
MIPGGCSMAVASSSSTQLQTDDFCLSQTFDTMSRPTGLGYFIFRDIEMVEQHQQQKAPEKPKEIRDLPLKTAVEEQCFPEPPWLHDFLRVTYFTSCHGRCSCDTNAHEVYFCISCGKGPFCLHTVLYDHRSSSTTNHTCIRVRKASRKDAVRVRDVQTLLDISGIQVYSFNGSDHLFLQSRPPSKINTTKRSDVPSCGICGRRIIDHLHRFCSISCKRIAIRNPSKHGKLSLSPVATHAAILTSLQAAADINLPSTSACVTEERDCHEGFILSWPQSEKKKRKTGSFDNFQIMQAAYTWACWKCQATSFMKDIYEQECHTN